jgi:hypothetical protein
MSHMSHVLSRTRRVDFRGTADKGAFRGTQLQGCGSKTYWLSTGDLVAPR